MAQLHCLKWNVQIYKEAVYSFCRTCNGTHSKTECHESRRLTEKEKERQRFVLDAEHASKWKRTIETGN